MSEKGEARAVCATVRASRKGEKEKAEDRGHTHAQTESMQHKRYMCATHQCFLLTSFWVVVHKVASQQAVASHLFSDLVLHLLFGLLLFERLQRCRLASRFRRLLLVPLLSLLVPRLLLLFLRFFLLWLLFRSTSWELLETGEKALNLGALCCFCGSFIGAAAAAGLLAQRCQKRFKLGPLLAGQGAAQQTHGLRHLRMVCQALLPLLHRVHAVGCKCAGNSQSKATKAQGNEEESKKTSSASSSSSSCCLSFPHSRLSFFAPK